MRAVLIPTDEAPREVDLPGSPGGTRLRALQELVGGYIEAVTIGTPWGPVVGYINEEGKLKRLPANRLATALARLDVIAGPMILVGAPNNEGEDTESPAGLLNWLTNREPWDRQCPRCWETAVDIRGRCHACGHQL